MMTRTGRWNVQWEKIKNPKKVFFKTHKEIIHTILDYVHELFTELNVQPTVTLVKSDEQKWSLSVFLNFPQIENGEVVQDNYVGLCYLDNDCLQVLWDENDYKTHICLKSNTTVVALKTFEQALADPEWETLFSLYHGNSDAIEYHPFVSSNLDPQDDRDCPECYLWNKQDFGSEVFQNCPQEQRIEFADEQGSP
jgi:hypothetical protein